LRWLIDRGDADIEAAMADTHRADSDASANPVASGLPITQVFHKQVAEIDCFGQTLLTVRRNGVPSAAEGQTVAPKGATPEAGEPPLDTDVDPAIADAVAQADAAAATALEKASLEPGPLGLQGKTINSPKQPDNPDRKPPEIMEGRNEGQFRYCFTVQMDKPFINNNGDWETVFRLVSTCTKEFLYRFDSAEFEDGNLISYTARGSYPTNGGGIPGFAVWPDKDPLPPELGFEPRSPFRGGEGLIYRGPPSWLGGAPEPGTYRVSQNAPQHVFKYYIVTCPRYDEQTGRENVMWVSGDRLMDSDTKWKCLPGPPAFTGNGPLKQ
jgi:hypothetical protein